MSLDQAKKVNAIGIFDNIFATNFPAAHRDMALIAKFEGTNTDKGDHKISVELRDDDDNKIVPSLDQNVVLGNAPITQGATSGGLVMRFQDLVFPKPGQYQFVLFGDDRFLGRVLFTVVKANVRGVGEP